MLLFPAPDRSRPSGASRPITARSWIKAAILGVTLVHLALFWFAFNSNLESYPVNERPSSVFLLSAALVETVLYSAWLFVSYFIAIGVLLVIYFALPGRPR